MKIKVLFKRLDKCTGDVISVDFKSFDLYDSYAKSKVLNSIGSFLSQKLESEFIFQIETFKEHEVCEFDIF